VNSVPQQPERPPCMSYTVRSIRLSCYRMSTEGMSFGGFGIRCLSAMKTQKMWRTSRYAFAHSTGTCMRQLPMVLQVFYSILINYLAKGIGR